MRRPGAKADIFDDPLFFFETKALLSALTFKGLLRFRPGPYPEVHIFNDSLRFMPKNQNCHSYLAGRDFTLGPTMWKDTRKIEQFFSVSTQCLDDHLFKTSRIRDRGRIFKHFIRKSFLHACIWFASAGLTFYGL